MHLDRRAVCSRKNLDPAPSRQGRKISADGVASEASFLVIDGLLKADSVAFRDDVLEVSVELQEAKRLVGLASEGLDDPSDLIKTDVQDLSGHAVLELEQDKL
ncbi:hypothetical protein SynSYN20_01556 [Synechococcus sp. SYN20]|nr:hypothetical protein SynSYN20_01556 [Synechococcus sp. SYN20]